MGFQGLGLHSRVSQREGAHRCEREAEWGCDCWQKCHSEQKAGMNTHHSPDLLSFSGALQWPNLPGNRR